MININNIRNNLENICYIYENIRNSESIALEYDDDATATVLSTRLKQYFLNQTWDTIDTGPLCHLKFNEDEGKLRSIFSFRRIKGIKVNSKKKLVIIDYWWLTSVERAKEGLKLLETNKVDEFQLQFPELNEYFLYQETDALMILLNHLQSLVLLKEEG